MNEKLHVRVRRLGLAIRHAVEVGVHHPETSNILGFMQEDVLCDLFEPDPQCLDRIRAAFADKPNVRVFPYAIFSEKREIPLYRRGASTFVGTLKTSPAIANDGYSPTDADRFFAEARVFSEFDDGTIDLLSVDTEGCEWYVLQHLQSRPVVISIETGWKRYRNPFLAEIEQWMAQNQYEIWYRDGSDSVYIRKGIRMSWWSRLWSRQ